MASVSAYSGEAGWSEELARRGSGPATYPQGKHWTRYFTALHLRFLTFKLTPVRQGHYED